MKPDYTVDVINGVDRRVKQAQTLYFATTLIGLSLRAVGSGLMLIVQLNYAVAPRFGR